MKRTGPRSGKRDWRSLFSIGDFGADLSVWCITDKRDVKYRGSGSYVSAAVSE